MDGQGQRDCLTLGTSTTKRMASTLHDCSPRLEDKGCRASNPLLVKRPARRAYPPSHPSIPFPEPAGTDMREGCSGR